MGKDWAKGLTAATDARIARNASAHRGLRYRTRDIDRGARIALSWSAEMAYVVGLMATDGCLVGDRRHLSLTSADVDLLETFRILIGKPNVKIRPKVSALGSAHDVQFGDVGLWRFLEAVGLTPRKSLTLGALFVPDEYFFDCARGLVDGDGSVENLVHVPTRRLYPQYRYERLIVKFHSASRAHIDWLRRTIERLALQRGHVGSTLPPGRVHPVYALKFGKRASIDPLQRIYRDPGAPSLRRKREVWRAYEERNGSPSVCHEARDHVGTIGSTPT